MPRKAAEVEGATVGAIYNIANHGAFSVTKVRNGPREQIVEFAPEGAGEAGEMGLSMWRKLAVPDWTQDEKTIKMLRDAATRMVVFGWPANLCDAVYKVIAGRDPFAPQPAGEEK